MYDYANISKVREDVGNDLDTYNKYMRNYHAGVWTDEKEINRKKYCRMLSIKEL